MTIPHRPTKIQPRSIKLLRLSRPTEPVDSDDAAVCQQRDLIHIQVRKCRVSEDHDINIRGLDNYLVDSSVTSSTEMDTSDTSGSDSDSNEFTTSSRSGIFEAEIMD